MTDQLIANPVNTMATLLSWLLVPMLMPVYGMLFIFNLSILDFSPLRTKTAITLIVFAINTLVPMLLVLALKWFGIIKDLGLNGRAERTIPYAIIILAMGCTGWYLYSRGAPLWTAMFFCGGAAAGVVNMIINFKWKISAHAAGCAGVFALLIHIAHQGLPVPGVFSWLVVWTIVCGLLGSARIWLRRHSLLQILAGFITGFLGVYLMMMIQ